MRFYNNIFAGSVTQSCSVLVLLSCIYLQSCNPGVYTQNLCGNYVYAEEGQNNHTIFGKHSIYGNVIRYACNDNFVLVEQMPNKGSYMIFLGSDLSTRYSMYHSYKADSTFLERNKTVYSKQDIKPDSNLYQLLSNKHVSLNNSKEDIATCEDIADSILSNDPAYKKLFSLKKAYWIISFPKDQLDGPFTEEEFLQKRNELHVPDDLKLKAAE